MIDHLCHSLFFSPIAIEIFPDGLSRPFWWQFSWQICPSTGVSNAIWQVEPRWWRGLSEDGREWHSLATPMCHVPAALEAPDHHPAAEGAQRDCHLRTERHGDTQNCFLQVLKIHFAERCFPRWATAHTVIVLKVLSIYNDLPGTTDLHQLHDWVGKHRQMDTAMRWPNSSCWVYSHSSHSLA